MALHGPATNLFMRIHLQTVYTFKKKRKIRSNYSINSSAVVVFNINSELQAIKSLERSYLFNKMENHVF